MLFRSEHVVGIISAVGACAVYMLAEGYADAGRPPGEIVGAADYEE